MQLEKLHFTCILNYEFCSDTKDRFPDDSTLEILHDFCMTIAAHSLIKYLDHEQPSCYDHVFFTFLAVSFLQGPIHKTKS